MPRFFTQMIQGDTAVITGEDARHISTVLRSKIGDSITLCDGEGHDYGCIITQINKDHVSVQTLTKDPTKSESSLRITLFQGLPKGDKMDLICEKAVELGVEAIVPFVSKFCVSRPDPASAAKKTERWQKRMTAAAKQSGRGILPQCRPVLTFDQMVTECQKTDHTLFFFERATAPLGEIVKNMTGSVSVIIGAEGGFSPEEAQKLTDAGIPCVTLGPRILRCETAPIAAITILQYATHNMD